MRNCVY